MTAFDLLHDLRPGDAEVDAAYPPERRLADLDAILVTPRREPSHAGRPRIRVGFVAAGTAILLAGIGITQFTPLLSSDGPLGAAAPSLGLGAPKAAAQSLADVARLASARPALVVGAGQFEHVRYVDTQVTDAATGSETLTIIHETYVASDGWTWRQDLQSGSGDATSFYMLYHPDKVPAGRLPTDPAALEQALRARSSGTASADQALFKELGEIALAGTASAELRAASIHVMQAMADRPAITQPARKGGTTTPRVSVAQETIDGSATVRATFTDLSQPGNGTVAYWFDAQTSEILRYAITGPSVEFRSDYQVRALVDALPSALTDVLGTTRVHREVQQ